MCYDEYDNKTKAGYNLYRSNHYDNNDEEAIQFYEEAEFLDFHQFILDWTKRRFK